MQKRLFERLLAKCKEENPESPAFSMKEDFKMGPLLGKGAFGHVYQATHNRIGHTVAVKVYEKKGLKDKTICMAIHREIHILS